jgi:putative MATE family efflux protein
VTLTLPMLLGVVGMVLFNIIDTFFVGQLGTKELAAISFTFPVVLVMVSTAMGLGMGASALISRAIGEGDTHRVQRLTTDAIVLSLIVVGIFAIAGLLSIDPLFRLMGAGPDLLPLIRSYMSIYYIGMIFMIVPATGNSVIRATGDTKTPGLVMLLAVLINTILDPLLIFGIGPFPRMEMAGAALATLISRSVVFWGVLWVLIRREKMLVFTIPDIRELFRSWKQILSIGLPVAGTNIVIPITIGVITGLLATYGKEAVAAFGVATRIDAFALMIVMSLASVLAPFVGQNWGAGQHERVHRAVQYSQQFVLLWGFVVFGLLALLARPIASVFSDNPDVVRTMTIYFWIVPLGYGFQGFIYLSNSVLNVLHKPLHAAGLSLTQTVVLHIPLAFLGSFLLDIPGIFSATVVAHVLVGVAAFAVLRRRLEKIRPEPEPEQEPLPLRSIGREPEKAV